MALKYRDKNIKSVAEFLSKYSGDRIASEESWFRGHSQKVEYHLRPWLHRISNGLEQETKLLTYFKQNAHTLVVRPPENDWEWMFIMQHHGAPTRLLDWTESPLTALYFAVRNNAHDSKDGALWVLLPRELNSLSSIPMIPGTESLEAKNYHPDAVNTGSMKPIAIIAPRNNLRMQVQQGVFTLSHQDPVALEDMTPQDHLWRYIIPAASKRNIRSELDILKINEYSLFPTLDNVASQVKELL